MPLISIVKVSGTASPCCWGEHCERVTVHKELRPSKPISVCFKAWLLCLKKCGCYIITLQWFSIGTIIGDFGNLWRHFFVFVLIINTTVVGYYWHLASRDQRYEIPWNVRDSCTQQGVPYVLCDIHISDSSVTKYKI